MIVDSGASSILDLRCVFFALLALTESRTLTGRVVDERRFPVVGATVTAHTVARSDPARAVTGSDGGFAIEVPFAPDVDSGAACTLFVTTSRRQVGHATLWCQPMEFEERHPLELREPIVLAECGRLTVDVADAEGVVPGAVIELQLPNGGLAITSAIADSQGHATIDPAPIGDFALFAKKSGRGRATVETRIASGGTSSARVELRALRMLAVELVDVDSGDPIPGATITATRLADGPNPGAFPNLNRHEALVSESRTTDARGRLELRDLESDSVLEIDATADHFAEWWPAAGSEREGDLGSLHQRTQQRVSAEASSVRLQMKRLALHTLCWRIVPGSAPTPPESTPLTVRFFDEERMHWRPVGLTAIRAVVRGAVVEIESEFPPGVDPSSQAISGWAAAPDGSIAELVTARADGDRTACFAPSAPLHVKLHAPDGSPQAEERVSAMLDWSDDRGAELPTEWSWTDESGVARFPSLRAGRWIVAVAGIARVVDLREPQALFVLRPPPPAEITFELTVDGERRLPGDLSLWIDGEHRPRRCEDPERGDVHVFVTRPAAGGELRVNLANAARGMITRVLPPLPESGTLVVRIAMQRGATGEAIARIHGASDLRAVVTLERQDEKSGTFSRADPEPWFHVQTAQRLEGSRVRGLEPGVWRLAIPDTRTYGVPARVVVDGPPAELVLDASAVAFVNLVWKLPDGEEEQFLEVETPGRPPRDRGWRAWESTWPLVPGEGGDRNLSLDRNAPPPLRVHHPYLVGSRWNDAIDLTKARSTITLHMELGPLVTFTPEFAIDVPFQHGAFVTLVDVHPSGSATKPDDVRRALRRGDTLAMAPPAAGDYRMLIDPILAAPVELDRVAFDSGPRDLGKLRFTAGSTLHVHARATAPFAAPHVVARATRIDGIAYERASSRYQAITAPTDPEIRALGSGVFRVTLESDLSGHRRAWNGEVRLDGVHDADLTIVTD